MEEWVSNQFGNEENVKVNETERRLKEKKQGKKNEKKMKKKRRRAETYLHAYI